MRFCKLHGCGNDYIVIESRECRGHDLAELARALCDRHFGAGADGVALVGAMSAMPGDFSARIFNPDGSEAEVSGNGTRCAAAYLYHSGGHSATTLRLHTLSGVKVFRLIERDSLRFTFETDMGAPRLHPREIPIDLPGAFESIIKYPLPVAGGAVDITALSMGNPHCTVFVPDWQQVDVAGLGRQLESHAAFPRRTNVEFVRVIDRGNIEARFYERGVGPTLSSGSSSCAATVAAVLNNFTSRRVQVHTAAGKLAVEWQTGGSVLLTGPAEVVYEADWLR